MLYTALHASRHAKPYVVQDLALPMAAVTEFVEFTEKTFGIYPPWLCPSRQSASPTFHPHISENTVDGRLQKSMLNIGLWGYGPGKHNAFMRANHALESELRKLGGMKWLYAQVYYSEKEFWEIYDRE